MYAKLSNNLNEQILANYNKAYSLAVNEGLYKKARALNRINLEEISKADLDLKGQAKLFQLQGWIDKRVGQYLSALGNFNDAQRLYESIDDKNGIAGIVTNIGNIYNYVDKNDLALEAYQKAKEIAIETESNVNLVYSYNNIAYTHQVNEDFELAIENYLKALELVPETQSLKMGGLIKQNIGHCYNKVGKYDAAANFLNQAKEEHQKDKYKIGLYYVITELANIDILQNKVPQNIQQLKDAYVYAGAIEDIQLQLECAKTLKSIYELKGDYKNAFKKQNQIELIKEKLNKEDVNKQLQVAKFQAEEQRKFREQQLKEEAYETSLKTQSRIKWILLIASALLIGLSLFNYNNYRLVKKAKQSLQLKHNDLLAAENILEQKNRDLQNYIDINIQLEQFANLASHDIKSPLRTITSFIGLLRVKSKNKLSTEENEYIDIIEKNSKRLNELVEDLLIYTKANSLELNAINFDLRAILLEVTSALDFIIKEQGTRVVIPAQPYFINGDKMMIKQVLQNLIDNALKFIRKDQENIIEIQFNEVNDKHIIKVIDNGIGIPDKYKSKIFEKFSQLNPKDAFEGTGLGLAICAEYIKRHNGQITVDNNAYGGATFVVEIPK